VSVHEPVPSFKKRIPTENSIMWLVAQELQFELDKCNDSDSDSETEPDL
jgi:hypothetical protein